MDTPATVTKSNSLITASYKMTLQEIRLIYAVLIDTNQYESLDSTRYYTVTASQWQKLFNVQRDTSYIEMRDAANKLYQRNIVIHDVLAYDDHEETRIIQAKKLSKGSGVVGIMFTTRICLYLSNLRSHFTKLVTQEVCKLQSAYHVRLYEFFMSVRHKQVVSVSLDEIYSLLQPPESMRRTDNCQRFILQPALAQINAVTSLAVSYETLKEGRKIVGFMFNIKTKTKKAVKKEKKPAAAVEFSSRLEIELFKQLQQVRPAVTQEEVLQQAKLEGVSVISMLEFLKKQQELLLQL